MPSPMPTLLPTNRPTHAPSPFPTKAPTQLPTRAPSSLPTKNPTALPTLHPSHLPTELPTTVDFLALVSLLENFFNDPFPSSNLHREALLWLTNDDAFVVARDPEQLLERFVMVLFYLGREPWADSTDWLSDDSICTWEGVDCDNGRIERFDIGTFCLRLHWFVANATISN